MLQKVADRAVCLRLSTCPQPRAFLAGCRSRFSNRVRLPAFSGSARLSDLLLQQAAAPKHWRAISPSRCGPRSSNSAISSASRPMRPSMRLSNWSKTVKARRSRAGECRPPQSAPRRRYRGRTGPPNSPAPTGSYSDGPPFRCTSGREYCPHARCAEPVPYIRLAAGEPPPPGLRVAATEIPGCFRILSSDLPLSQITDLRFQDIGSQSVLPRLDLQARALLFGSLCRARK